MSRTGSEAGRAGRRGSSRLLRPRRRGRGLPGPDARGCASWNRSPRICRCPTPTAGSSRQVRRRFGPRANSPSPLAQRARGCDVAYTLSRSASTETVGADLRRGDRCVAEELLHDPHVGAAPQQVGRERSAAECAAARRARSVARRSAAGVDDRATRALARQRRTARAEEQLGRSHVPRRDNSGRARVRYRSPGRPRAYDPTGTMRSCGPLAAAPGAHRRERRRRRRAARSPRRERWQGVEAARAVHDRARPGEFGARWRAWPGGEKADLDASSSFFDLIDRERLRQPARLFRGGTQASSTGRCSRPPHARGSGADPAPRTAAVPGTRTPSAAVPQPDRAMKPPTSVGYVTRGVSATPCSPSHVECTPRDLDGWAAATVLCGQSAVSNRDVPQVRGRLHARCMTEPRAPHVSRSRSSARATRSRSGAASASTVIDPVAACPRESPPTTSSSATHSRTRCRPLHPRVHGQRPLGRARPAREEQVHDLVVATSAS